MGINFGDMNAAASAPAPTPAPMAPAGMTLDLSKNVVLDVTKRNPGLKRLVVGAGWDTSRSTTAIDLDVIAFACNANGKVTSTSNVVFFNNKSISGITLNGDNLTGEGEGDDETIDVDLSAVASDIQSIVFAVAIYDAVNRRQTFGMVNNSYVRLLDKESNNRELCHFILKDDYSTDTAVVFAKLVRNGSEWDFVTIGEGKQADLTGLLQLFS
jgi:tellurium resistance protein TerD